MQGETLCCYNDTRRELTTRRRGPLCLGAAVYFTVVYAMIPVAAMQAAIKTASIPLPVSIVQATPQEGVSLPPQALLQTPVTYLLPINFQNRFLKSSCWYSFAQYPTQTIDDAGMLISNSD
jgi:hypothetical protein